MNMAKTKLIKKITLKELRNDPIFSNIEESFEKAYPGKTALELQHEWIQPDDPLKTKNN